MAESPKWMFTKALSHRQKVLRLYKRSLRSAYWWYINEPLELRFQQCLIRARFDDAKDEIDHMKSRKLLIDGFRELWEKRHPNIFNQRWPSDPGGVAYERNPVAPDDQLDHWTSVDKEQFPYYFNRREERKRELLAVWEKIEEGWDKELEGIQKTPPPPDPIVNGKQQQTTV